MKSALESATPPAFEGEDLISNLIPSTGLDYQEPPYDIDSDITLAGSFGTNDNESTYLELRKNLATIENTTPDLLAIIEETGYILEVFGNRLDRINAPRVLFNQDN